MERLKHLVVTVLAALAAVGMAYSAAWLLTYGPAVVAETWVGTAVVAVLWFVAGGTALFTSMRYFDQHGLLLAISFLGLGLAVAMMPSLVEAQALQDRGAFARCAILHIDKRVETHTGAAGDPETTVYYDHRLDCTADDVRTLTTTDDPAGRDGVRITVAYDPAGRVTPRPAERATNTSIPTWISGVALALAIVVRSGLELRGRDLGIDLFAPGRGPGARVRFGLTMVALGSAAAAAVVLLGGLVLWTSEALLATLGVPEHVRTGWLRWVVGIVAGLMLNYLLELLRRVYLRLLRRFRRMLDPDGSIGKFVAEAEIEMGFQFSLFGIDVSFDGGILGFLKGGLISWFRRLRRR